MEGKTNIQVSRATRDALIKLGKKGDTYDDIIRGLLKCKKGREYEKD